MRPRRHRLRDRRTNAGFTLIELIVVIVILGILVAVAAFTYNAVVRNARQDAVRKTAAQIATSLQGYSATKQAPYGAAAFDRATVDDIIDGDTDATVSAMVDDPANGYATVTVTRDGYTVEVHCPLGKVGAVCRTGNGGGGGGVPPVVVTAMRAVSSSSADGRVTFEAIKTLPDGAAIVAGQASGTVTFGTHTFTTADTGDLSQNQDIVVAKLNADGTWAWVSTAGGTFQDFAYDVAVDGSGNIYIAGQASAATFGSLPGTHSGLIVAKLNADGDWVWVTTQDAGYGVSGHGLAVTPAGDLVVVGTIWTAATFGPDSLTNPGHNAILVAKLTSFGNWLWARRSSPTSLDNASKVAVDGSGNIYIAGTFQGASQFGVHPVTGNGFYDVVAAKLDPAGTWQWATAGGGGGYDYLDDIAVDPTGHPVVTGMIGGTATFGSKSVAADSSGDVLVAKLDPVTGDPAWAVTGGGTEWDEGYGVTTDGAGNIFVAAYANGGGTYGSQTLTGYQLAAKLTPTGDWTWVRHAGASINDSPYDVAVTSAGKVLVAGEFYDSVTFGPTVLTEGGYGSGFVAWWDADGSQL